jgi:hypothetical protein
VLKSLDGNESRRDSLSRDGNQIVRVLDRREAVPRPVVLDADHEFAAIVFACRRRPPVRFILCG